MLTLPNGFSFDFCCASGALGFDGKGWWWEAPLRWLGVLRPSEFAIIAKTVTFAPRKGNLRMYAPWRCVRLIPGGAVNAVGLTNMGYEAWIRDYYPRAIRRGYDLIASVQPHNAREGAAMGRALAGLNLRAVEVNLSCPNTNDKYDPQEVIGSVKDNVGKLPVIAKLGAHRLMEVITLIDPWVDAYDLINTIPWPDVFKDTPSPLAKYNLVGGVSGEPIRQEARNAIAKATLVTKKPIISGGGIDSAEECVTRKFLGASAFSLGTVFLRKPWRPNRIVSEYRSLQK